MHFCHALALPMSKLAAFSLFDKHFTMFLQQSLQRGGVCVFLLEIDILTELVLSLNRVGLKTLCRTACVFQYIRCCLIFEVLKALKN